MAARVDSSISSLSLSQQPRSPSPTSVEVEHFFLNGFRPGSSRIDSRVFTPIQCQTTSPVIQALNERRVSDALLLLKFYPQYLELGDEWGKTPLACACYVGVSPQCVSKLIEMGANPCVVSRNGYTPNYFAYIGGHEDLLEGLPFDPSLQFVLDHKFLGHFFELSRKFQWKNEINCKMEYFDFYPLAVKMGKIFRDYHQLNFCHYFSLKCFDELKFYLKLIEKPNEDFTLIAHLLKAGKAYVCPSGWINHRIVVVCVKEYLVICNPDSTPTITIYKVDLKLLTPNIVQEMVDSVGEMEKEEGKVYFYHTLPQQLGCRNQVLSDEESSLFASLRKAAPRKQRAAVCSFSSQMEALFVVAAFQSLRDHPEKPSNEVVGDVAREMKRIHLYLQATFLASFLEKYRRDENIDRPLMHQLVGRVCRDLSRLSDFKTLCFEHPGSPSLTLKGDQLVRWFCSI